MMCYEYNQSTLFACLKFVGLSRWAADLRDKKGVENEGKRGEFQTGCTDEEVITDDK